MIHKVNSDIEDYGYGRVSAKDQNEARQIKALLEVGVKRENIFLDKQSGADFNRPQYKRLLKKLKKGDILYIKSIDRLGRNYDEIQVQWKHLTHDIQADIVVLDMPLLDTRTEKDLTGTLISDIVLQLLSYVAETERRFIRQRQQEGIMLAKEKGIKFGRSCKTDREHFVALYEEMQRGNITKTEILEELNIAPCTFYRYRNQWIEKKRKI